jgi:hypothetical protein
MMTNLPSYDEITRFDGSQLFKEKKKKEQRKKTEKGRKEKRKKGIKRRKI